MDLETITLFKLALVATLFFFSFRKTQNMMAQQQRHK